MVSMRRQPSLCAVAGVAFGDSLDSSVLLGFTAGDGAREVGSFFDSFELQRWIGYRKVASILRRVAFHEGGS